MKPKSKTTKGLSGEGEWRLTLVYAPPGWALFELRVDGGEWKLNEYASGVFSFGEDLAGDMAAMDEFVILALRYPNARVYFEDELGNERRQSWLEYAMHRLEDEPRPISFAPDEETGKYADSKLERWGYWDTSAEARRAIKLGIKAIAQWKEES